MIQTELVDYGGNQLKRTWSDKGLYIECDGALFSDVLEDPDSTRTFTETEKELDEDAPGTAYFSPTQDKEKAEAEEQKSINMQQDEMLAELYESMIGGDDV